ncbi:SH3 domain-containing protein [Neisseria subflava]|uniref:SH3 domain-containing protein n=1 Tax=Neisseria subflava TaxID=28449 RepID=UPI001C999928|nr:SH3 domain-containing protein [Neisseria subflava]MBY6285684.1 SH3 domain-containing protein [Neisseria subflava]
MRYLATVLFLCSALTHAAPPNGFALVHDADGHTNLRESPDLNAKVLAKIPNGTPLECLGDGGEGSLSFCTAQLQQPAAEDYGFIHYSRLIFPASDKNFVRLREQSGHDDTLTLSGNGQKVHIVARRIHPKRSDFSGISKDKYTARLYQGKPFYGMDSMISKSVFALERITLNGQAVPAAELQGLFSPDFATTARDSNVYQGWEAYYRGNDKTLYLFGRQGSDGNPFSICFIFKDGKFQRRYLWGAVI